jgi:hypothetical protein
LAEQTEALARRQRDLERSAAELRKREAQWDTERGGYQQEIRRLLRQLRRSEAVVA